MSDAWNALREQIEYFSQPFPEAAIALADAHREEVTPHLADAMERLTDHPDIGAVEILERSQGWFADDLPDPAIADLPWIERHISRPCETGRDEQLGRGKGCVRSVKGEIGWWAGSAEDPPVKTRPAPVVARARQGIKIGRNDPCPCGSGKKYKKSHGA